VPFESNPYRRRFRGSFQQEAGKVLLIGVFETPLYAKVFTYYSIGFSIVSTLITIYAVSTDANLPRWFLVPAVALFLAFTIGNTFFMWLTRNDELWLSNVIRGALSPNKEAK